MASNHTQHYGLCQWEATDAVLRTDFNEDNQKIDTALKTQAGNISDLTAQMANKANTGAVNSLAEEVAQKANQSDLEAEKAAREAADTENMEALRNENCWVKLGAYTLDRPAAELVISIPQISQMRKLVLEHNSGGCGAYSVMFLSGDDLTAGTSEAAADLSFRSDTMAGGNLEIFPCGGEGHLGYFSHYVSLDGDLQFDDTYAGCSPNWLRFSELAAIRVYTGQGQFMAAGSQFILYGLKK